MPGPSRRLWSTLSAAAHRSLVLKTVKEIRAAFASSSQALEALRPTSVSEIQPVPCSSLITRILSSSRGWRATSEPGGWRAQISSSPLLPSQPSSELSCQGFHNPNSHSATIWSLFRGRRFASSTSYAAKPPRREQQGGKGSDARARSHAKSRQPGAGVARKGRPAFRGALSSIKNLQSEEGRGNSRRNSVRGDARKRLATLSGPSSGKSGRAIPSPPRKSSPDTTRFIKFKDRPADQGK